MHKALIVTWPASQMHLPEFLKLPSSWWVRSAQGMLSLFSTLHNCTLARISITTVIIKVLQNTAWCCPQLIGFAGHCSCVDGVLGFLSEALAGLARRPHHFWDLTKTLQEAHTSGPPQGRYSRHKSEWTLCVVDASLCQACC